MTDSLQNDFSAAANPRQYIPAEFIEKYPTLGMVLDAQAPYLHYMNPDTYKSMQPRIIALFEDTLGNEEDPTREAMMVAAIYSTSPRPLERPSLLALEYGIEAAEMIYEMHNTDYNDMSTSQARLSTAIMIWEMEQQIDSLKNGGAEAYINFMRTETTKKWDRDEMHLLLFENLQAPALEAMYIRTERALMIESGIERPRNGRYRFGPN